MRSLYTALIVAACLGSHVLADETQIALEASNSELLKLVPAKLTRQLQKSRECGLTKGGEPACFPV